MTLLNPHRATFGSTLIAAIAAIAATMVVASIADVTAVKSIIISFLTFNELDYHAETPRGQISDHG